MPLYDYRCADCRRPFEALLDRWDAPAPECPHCGAAGAVRQLSVFAVTSSSAGSAPSSREPGPCGSSNCACRMSPN